MRTRRLTPILAAAILAACADPTPQTADAAPPSPAHAPEPSPCDHAGELFDLYVAKRDSEGWTERDALADLSARGDYAMGYVTDAAFGDRYGEAGSATARAEMMVDCRRRFER